MYPLATVLLITVLASCSACRSPNPESPPPRRFEFAQAQMGLEFRIVLYAPSEPVASNAVKAAFARIAELNAVLSDYDSDSELSRLSLTSGSNEWIRVSDDLWTVLWSGQQLSNESKGAFDLTIGPSVNLWRRARRRHQLPDAALLTAMKARVGYTNLLLDAGTQSANLLTNNMRLDAGGIAKGYAMDEALEVIRDHGIRRVMIHGGGDMVFGAPPPDRNGWHIELTEAGTNILSIANAALATSGDLVQFLEIDGVRYSHIIDPRTGVGLTNRRLVHVIAASGLLADSLATTLNILGEREAREFLKHHADVEARIITLVNDEPTIFETKGFSRYRVSASRGITK